MKRGVEGGVSEMRDSVLGADVAVEGLDRAQECPRRALGPSHFLQRHGTGPRKGQPTPNLVVPEGLQGYFL